MIGSLSSLSHSEALAMPSPVGAARTPSPAGRGARAQVLLETVDLMEISAKMTMHNANRFATTRVQWNRVLQNALQARDRRSAEPPTRVNETYDEAMMRL